MLNNQIKIYQIGDCKIVETPGWILHFFKDESFILLPPPNWLLELVDLLENKIISHNSAKIVLETWMIETLKRISKGMSELQMLFCT